jgi:hypothetical protein
MQCGQHVLVRVEGREHGHDRPVRELPKLAQHGEPVDLRHPDVQQDDVRAVFPNGAEGFRPRGRGDDPDVRRGVQDELESGANECLVVHDHYPDHVLSVPARSASPACSRA